MIERPARHEIVALLRTAPDIYGEATPFRQLMIKATPSDLRDAIRECLLTPSSASVNRRRMGLLASVLIERMDAAYSDQFDAEGRATNAERRLKALQDAQPASDAALATLPRKPDITRLKPKPKRRRKEAV